MIEIVDALIALFTVLGILGAGFTWYINARMSALSAEAKEQFHDEIRRLRETLFQHLDQFYMRRDLLESKLERLRSPEVIDKLAAMRLQVQIRDKNIMAELESIKRQLNSLSKE